MQDWHLRRSVLPDLSSSGVGMEDTIPSRRLVNDRIRYKAKAFVCLYSI